MQIRRGLPAVSHIEISEEGKKDTIPDKTTPNETISDDVFTFAVRLFALFEDFISILEIRIRTDSHTARLRDEALRLCLMSPAEAKKQMGLECITQVNFVYTNRAGEEYEGEATKTQLLLAANASEADREVVREIWSNAMDYVRTQLSYILQPTSHT